VSRLLLPDGVVFTCQQSGACCRSDWLIGVDAAARTRLEALDWTRVDPPLPAGPKFVPLPFALPGGERSTFARRADGACVFLDGDGRCGIHTRLGAAAKPQVCREFPYSFVETPDGVAVGLSFACTAVRAHHGRALSEQQDEIEAVLSGSTRVRRLPEPLTLYSGLDLAWTQYRPIERALLTLLGDERCTLPTALVAGSALISVCVGVARAEAAARRAGRAPRETVEGALAQLEVEGYRAVMSIAERARAPQRPRLTPLAPLYTWLEFQHRRPSRIGLVCALYRNLLRFRRGRGRVRDFITGGPPFDIAEVGAVAFDATEPEHQRFLREYWRHVVFRKTLTPLHGVFRGYQTLLVLYAFTRWAAKLSASRDGRSTVGLGDVKDAVRLIDQRLVLHARFADVFALSPDLTLMADRLYQDPAFVRWAALDT
jgi:Fe-S-cluster containining protein